MPIKPPAIDRLGQSVHSIEIAIIFPKENSNIVPTAKVAELTRSDNLVNLTTFRLRSSDQLITGLNSIDLLDIFAITSGVINRITFTINHPPPLSDKYKLTVHPSKAVIIAIFSLTKFVLLMTKASKKQNNKEIKSIIFYIL